MSDQDRAQFPEGPSNEEIATRLSRIKEELNQMNDLPELSDHVVPVSTPHEAPPLDEIEAKVAEIQAKVSAKTDQRRRDQLQRERELKRSGAESRSLGLGLSITYAVLGSPMLGYGIGALIDSRTGLPVGKAIGGLLGMTFGVVAALLLLQRQSKIDP